MDAALATAFGIGEDDPDNPVQRLAEGFIGQADGDRDGALYLACGALVLAQARVQRQDQLISAGYVRRAFGSFVP